MYVKRVSYKARKRQDAIICGVALTVGALVILAIAVGFALTVAGAR